MTDEVNYRSFEPPRDKPLSDYSSIERRAKIYNLIEQAGHFRNIEQSQQELGERFDVSQQQISKDIRKINEWMADQLGENAETELQSLHNAAVKSLLDEGKPEQAYQIAQSHYKLLQSMGEKDRESQELEVEWRDFVSDE